MSPFGKAAIAAALICKMSLASADVLTFDDLGPGPDFFVSDYHGFRFGTNDEDTNAWFHTTEASSFYVPKSGAGYAATDFTLYVGQPSYIPTQPISSAIPFVFVGAWFSGDAPVGYELYNGATLVATTGPSAPLTDEPTFIASEYSGLVTSVVVFGDQGFYALDDFTYNPSNATPIPEPQSCALVLAGLAAIGMVAVRRRRFS